MSSRKCIFISTSIHEKLTDYAQASQPKASIGNCAELAIERLLKFSEINKSGITPEDIALWKQAFDDSNLPPTNQTY